MTVQPQSVAELQDAVRAHPAITIRGAGTKSARVTSADGRVTLDLRALSGISEYSPDECVFTTLAGTPLADITSRLAAHGQYLPFDPPLIEAGATIGGTVVAGLSGSGRYRYGGVRDFVIGARVVDGEGRLIRSGGKVVKNAAGFLLHHGMVGSQGRFGVLAEVTFKVFPAPEARATLRVDCGSVETACETVRAIQNSRFDLEAIDFDSTGTMWIRIAGRAETLAARMQRLQQAISGISWTKVPLYEPVSDEERTWSDAREFAWQPAESSLVKIPVADMARLTPSPTTVRYTCGGNCLWVADRDLTALSEALSRANLRGQVVRGEKAGTIIGLVERNEFEERVRSVLDPRNRFSAASDSGR